MGWWENIQLKVGGVDARVRAMEQLGASGDPAHVDAVAAAALEDNSPLVQKAAAEALGKLGDPKGIPALAAMLQHGKPEVQKASALSLQKIGSVQAVAPLAAALTNLDPEVRQTAMQGLVAIGPPSLGPLVGLLKDMNREALRAVALRDWNQAAALGAAAVPCLVAALKDADNRVAEAAAGSLTKVGPAAVSPLLEALKDENPVKRSQAARALGEIRNPETAPALMELLRDADGTVRESVVLALWRMGG